MHMIEGTWEEIERRKSELIGQHLRVIIMPEQPSASEKVTEAAQETPVIPKPKELKAWGMLAGILSTEEYLREKREDMAREDRSL